MFTQEQVEYLNRLYPEMCPNLKMTEREIWRYVGARELVRHINHLFQDQLESNKLLRK